MALETIDNTNEQINDNVVREVTIDDLYISYPDVVDVPTLLKIHRLIEKGVALNREIKSKETEVESIKTQINAMMISQQLVEGKYVTSNNCILRITQAEEYSALDSSEVFEYLLENKVEYSFNELFSVGFTKLKDLIGSKAEMFRKLLPRKITKISFK